MTLDFAPTEEQEQLRETVKKLLNVHMSREAARELELSQAFPRQVWKEFGRAGLLGLPISEELGGGGGSVSDLVIVIEEAARVSLALAIPIITTVSQAAKVLSILGSAEQRARYLGPIIDGDIVATMAWTEPSGGSDVLTMSTRADRTADGWLMNGNKTFITLADKADLILTMARTRQDQPRRSDGITCFAVPGGTDGVTARPIPKAAQKATTFCDVAFTNALLPDGAIVGTEGEAWQEMSPLLSSERTCFAAACIGLAKASLADTLIYVNERQAFGKSINHFQAVQHHLVEMELAIASAELLMHKAAWCESSGRPFVQAATQALIAASEAASMVTDRGLQLFGGYGITEEFDIERYWRDARVFRVSPITTEVAKNVLAYHLGLPRSF